MTSELNIQTTPDPAIQGICDTRFEPVKQVFHDNFLQRNEIGAAICLSVEGKVIIDLWGGFCNAAKSQRWQRDTMVNSYSVGKGILATLILRLVELGQLDFDTKVSNYWPEFGAADKGDISLRTLLAHQSGLPAIREPLPADSVFDWHRICQSLAAQAPYWEPGTGHGYHIGTYGFLVGEVVRRVTGLSVGTALSQLLIKPLGEDYYYGVATKDQQRISDIILSGAGSKPIEDPEDWARIFPASGNHDHDQMLWHAYFNPAGINGIGYINTVAWRQAEIPSANGHGTARAVNAVYRALLGHSIVSPLLLKEATNIASDGKDILLGKPSRYGLGFQLTQAKRQIGPNPHSFGHRGYGGSIGFADPSTNIAFAYLTNRPGERQYDPRTEALIDAVYACV